MILLGNAKGIKIEGQVFVGTTIFWFKLRLNLKLIRAGREK
jgi:hypothetical protein